MPPTQEERRRFLIRALLQESPLYRNEGIQIPPHEEDQKRLLRALFNVRAPGEAREELLFVQDAYLQERARQAGITNMEDLEPEAPHQYLWMGDITTLAVDAIVNAANSEMLGCFIPNHACIDNAIHTFSGIQLRLECARIMERQGHPEEPGGVKMTAAYNLPARHVLHTVGPIVRGRVTKKDEKLLESCYAACYQQAKEAGLSSIAYCCISTGVFSFPRVRAAQIAFATVGALQAADEEPLDVVFNVFSQEDYEIYHDLFRGN